MRLSFKWGYTLNNCWTCSLVMPGGNRLCCPIAFPLLPCCGMPWLGCTAAMFSSCSSSELSQSILYAPISIDCAPTVQLIISHARLLGRRGGHPGWAHSDWRSKSPSAVDGCWSRPVEPSAQSAVPAVMVLAAWSRGWGGRAAQRCAGNSKGGVWLGCGVCKMFRDGRRDTDALLVGVELVGSGCHSRCSLLLPWPLASEAGERASESERGKFDPCFSASAARQAEITRDLAT